jgi:DNA-binding MarR family transcriptional regulator
MKRESLEVQKEVLETIRKNNGITMSQLERKIGTNPSSLKKHCEALEQLGLIKIIKEEDTQKIYFNK